MSYSIIFETKIAELSDGRIIHFDRSGCNNDTCGRSRNEFIGKIYTKEEFIAKAENFKCKSAPYKETGNFEMKIGNRYATMYDYGEHLLRMLKRAVSYKDFIKDRSVSAAYCKSIQLIEPERKEMTLGEFNRLYSELMCSGKTFRYARIMEYPNINDEGLIVQLLEANTPVEFYIGKQHKYL